MSTLSCSALRARIATQIATISGTTLSPHPLDVFAMTANTIYNKGFAVGLLTSDPLPDRQRPSNGLALRTTVRIRYALRLAPKDQVSSYDSALNLEEQIIQKMLEQNATLQASLHIALRAVASRDVSDQAEWFVGEIDFDCIHRISLT
jgi:hypothetical protein